MRRARAGDLPTLLDLMTGFYAEAGYRLDRTLAENAFAAVVADERLGYIWLIDEEAKTAGYVVVTVRYGMEYGGLIACIDDLFVVPQCRNKGLGRAALLEIRDFCASIGIRAITVEVGYGNVAAQAVYRRLGLVEAADRQLLFLGLAPPTHVV